MNKRTTVEQKKLANISKVFIIPSLIFLFFSFQTELYPFLIIGLLCGWVGDIALILPTDKSKGVRGLLPLIIGMAAFMVGHIFYAGFFLQIGFPLLKSNYLTLLFFLPYLFYGLIAIPLLGLTDKKGIIIISIYFLALSFMSYSALTQLIARANFNYVIVFAGSLFFLISDSCLALKMFKGVKISDRLVMSTYITAQMFFVIGYIWK